MSIQEILRKFKDFLTNPDLLLIVVIMLVGVGSFLLGQHSMAPETEQALVSGATTPTTLPESTEEVAIPAQTSYVASKTGTKYHLPWCSGAQRIKEENKVWFESERAAKEAGYAPASNCKGL